MRSKRSLYIIITICISQILSLFYSLIIKQAFLEFFDISLLGVTGLFDSFVLSLMLVQASFGAVLIYDLYKPFSDSNEKEIRYTIAIFKKVFSYISWGIVALASILLPFITLIFNIDGVDIYLVYFIYIIQIISTLFRFKMYHKIIIFKVNQKEYQSNLVLIVMDFVTFCLKYVSILYFNNFVLYIIIVVCYPALTEFITKKVIDRKYTFLEEPVKIDFHDVVRYDVFGKLKKYSIKLVYDLIYVPMDNLIISICLSTSVLGYVSNYSMIFMTASSFLNIISSSFRSMLADFMYKEKNEYNFFMLYKSVNLFFYMLVSVVAVGLYAMMDDFVLLWLGKEYVLDKSITICFVIWICIEGLFRISENIFVINGYMYKERLPLIFSIVVNLIVSIVLLNYLGLVGIYVGTICGTIIYYIGKMYYLCKYVFSKYKKEYIFQLITLTMTVILQTIIVTHFLSWLIPNINSIGSFVYSIITIVVLVTVSNLVLFMHKAEFKIMVNSIKSAILKEKS